MRESRTYGSVRGARGNSRPYREASTHLSKTFAASAHVSNWHELGESNRFNILRCKPCQKAHIDTQNVFAEL
jgi:hypothetical protein